MSQLKGLKVLELASVLAGPGVGQFFAELGADVIKVENLKTGGDVTRTWKLAGEMTDDRSAYFCAVNWGKRSVALDLTLPPHRAIVHKLALRSDIVIASYKPGDAEKLGVDYATLSKDRRGLIYGQVSGYGPGNPRVGYDAIIQAEAGFMFMNGEPGGASLKMPVAMVDVLAGHQLKEGLLLAMLEKTMTGEGKLVEVSLLQTAVSSLANQATNWLVANKLPKKHGSAHPNIAPYGDVFSTADGKEMLLAVGSDRQFGDLCGVLGMPGIYTAPEFANNASRVRNRDALNVVLKSAVARFTASDLMEKMNHFKIPAGIIQNMEQVFEMPEANELLLSGNGLKGVRTYAVKTPGQDVITLLPPPSLGEHTDEVIRLLDH